VLQDMLHEPILESATTPEEKLQLADPVLGTSPLGYPWAKISQNFLVV